MNSPSLHRNWHFWWRPWRACTCHPCSPPTCPLSACLGLSFLRSLGEKCICYIWCTGSFSLNVFKKKKKKKKKVYRWTKINKEKNKGTHRICLPSIWLSLGSDKTPDRILRSPELAANLLASLEEKANWFVTTGHFLTGRHVQKQLTYISCCVSLKTLRKFLCREGWIFLVSLKVNLRTHLVSAQATLPVSACSLHTPHLPEQIASWPPLLWHGHWSMSTCTEAFSDI